MYKGRSLQSLKDELASDQSKISYYRSIGWSERYLEKWKESVCDLKKEIAARKEK